MSDASRSRTAVWSPVVIPVDGLVAGEDIVVSTVELDPVRVALFRHSVNAAVGQVAPVAAGIADLCPDPLVFALEAGLRRPQILDRAIDGGSEWIDMAPVPAGPLCAVSRVSAIEERTTSAGRRAVRVVYETTATSARGAVVGIARGISMHVEGRA